MDLLTLSKTTFASCIDFVGLNASTKNGLLHACTVDPSSLQSLRFHSK